MKYRCRICDRLVKEEELTDHIFEHEPYEFYGEVVKND